MMMTRPTDPPGLSTAALAPIWAAGLLLAILDPRPTAAQDAPVACTQLGTPLPVAGLPTLEGSYVRSLDTAYVERIGVFTDGLTRSVRTAPDGSRSAHLVKTSGRELCVTRADGREETCTVPITCASGEVDMVLFDASQTAFAAISLADSSFAQAQEAAAKDDWVPFSGGSAPITLSGPVPGSQPLPVSAAADDCTNVAVPPQSPGSLANIALFHWNGACQAGSPSGDGELIMVEEGGDTRLIVVRGTFGMRFQNGALTYSGNEIALTATCNGPTEERIPRDAEGVTSVDIVARFPAYANLGESLIQEEVARQSLAFAEGICGDAVRNGPVRLVLMPQTPQGNDSVRMEYQGGERTALQIGQTITRGRTTREEVALEAALPIFADHVQAQIFRAFEAATRQRIADGGPLNVLADGIAIAPHEFLVALTQGVATRMPWKAMMPVFEDGHFVVSWRSAAYLPVRDFFSRRNSGAWVRISQQIGQDSPLSSLDVVCHVPADAADGLASSDWVSVDATIRSYTPFQLNLTCQP